MKDSPGSHNNSKRNKMILWGLGTVSLICFVVFLYWMFFARFEEETKDAYVSGNIVTITSRISGTPVALFVEDMALVDEGSPLLALDSTDYQLAFEREQVNLALAARQVKGLWEDKQIKEANVALQKAQLSKARTDWINRLQLIALHAISNEDLQHAKISVEQGEARLTMALRQLGAATAALGSTSLENHPLIQNSSIALRSAYLNLQRCLLRAPVRGYVAKKRVQVGETIQVTTPLMSVIPLDHVWVDANFLETQLKQMRIGQTAKVVVDLYGGSVPFEGKVSGINAGTGSVFSLLPAQNATGNWIKVVQRVAVRIELTDPEALKKFPLRLGLSCNVVVDTHNTSGRSLAEQPRSAALVSTSVFTPSFDDLSELISTIVQTNLQVE